MRLSDAGFKGCLLLLVVSVARCGSSAMDLLEFLLGPRIGRSYSSSKSLCISSAEELARSNGYPFEKHEVTTEDGYILGLHRIPHGRHKKNQGNSPRPVALFQHGLLAASDTWLFRGADKDLPYVLADSGYDVWMCNMRGNVYSRRHKTFNPDKDTEYWQFSLHEVGYYDLPATIDYVLNTVKQKQLFILGHSVGSSAAFILSALRPEYNKKIKLQLALAPLIFVLHEIPFTQRLLILPAASLSQIAISQNILNIFPRRTHFSKMLEMMCNNGVPTQQLCLAVAFALVGEGYSQFNSSYFPLVAKYYPAGSSIYLTTHAYQIYQNGLFEPLDYGEEHINLKKYKESVPSPYNLSLVTHPVSLHYGEGDLLVTKEDIDFTETKLPNVVNKQAVPFRDFNHMDFMWGEDAKELLYDKLILIMDKYR